METTIDKAGRVVIPVAARKEARLSPGTPLTVVVEGGDIRLVRAVKGPKIERIGGRLVARPQVSAAGLPELDPARLVQQERGRAS
jgi:AbrB family looped-hinge helix DNA binding protein